MRGTFVRALTDLAERDGRILFLTGDLGYTVVEPFAKRFPDRFFNVGVAEQNMVGLATGLSEAGYIPFVYSIATFASLRAYEFIRNGPVLHQLPVRIVGVGGGFEYGSAGPTHHALEDVGIMRLQPGLTVIAPADYEQARAALEASWDLPGPIYYRLGKDDRTRLPGLGGRFELGRSHLVRGGTHLLLVALGSAAVEAAAAAELLAERRIDAAVLVVSSVNPPPADLAAHLAERSLVMTIEDHYATGGLGSLVAEVIADRGLRCRLVRCGVRELSGGRSGSEGYMRATHRLGRAQLVEAALETVHASS